MKDSGETLSESSKSESVVLWPAVKMESYALHNIYAVRNYQ